MQAELSLATVTVVGCILLVSGIQKLRSGNVVIAVANYNILPVQLLRIAAPALPWAEVGLGAGLMMGVATSVLLLASVGLLLLFCVGIAVNLMRGRRIDCGCRGGSQPISWTLLLTDLALATGCAAAAFASPAGPAAVLAGLTSQQPSDAFATVFALVSLWLTWLLTRLGADVWRGLASTKLAESL